MQRFNVGLLALACSVLAGCAQSPLEPRPSFTEIALEVESPELIYFEEVALGPEYGSARSLVRKWDRPLRIQLHGTPTAADRAALAAVLDDLHRLIGPEWLSLVDHDANVDLWFTPLSTFSEIEPSYVAGNLGFYWVHWNGSGVIEQARVLIASDHTTPVQRAHLIREELTQAMGLFRDSARYPESIFFKGWSETTSYAPIDEVLIRMLYHSEVRPGMSPAEAIFVLSGLQLTP